MRTSKSAAQIGRHRKRRDRGFSAVEVIAAATVVSGVIAGGAVLANHVGEPQARVADTVAPTSQQAPVHVETDPAEPGQPVENDQTVDRKATKPAVEQPTAKTQVRPASCSTRKGDVTLEVDAVVHALGVSGGTIRTSAAEADVIARPADGNPCSKDIKLYMGEDYAFEGRLPYGKWILDIDLSGATTSVPLAVDRATVEAPKQLIGGDCGGSKKVTVKTRTEDSVLGLNGALPGAKVTAKRVPDGECAVPAESSFTTGADGSFTGTIGYGDWMFSVTTASGTVSDFVTVKRSTTEVVLTQTLELL